MMKLTIETSENMTLVQKGTSTVVVGIMLVLIGAASIAYILSTDADPFPWWVGGIGMALGILLVLLKKDIQVLFDKAGNLFEFTSKGWFGAKKITKQLDQVQRVALMSEYITRSSGGTNADTRSQMRTHFNIIFTDGQIISLADEAAGTTLSGVGALNVPNQENANKLSTFLSVPLDISGPPSIGTLMKGISEAIAQSKQEKPVEQPPLQ